MINVKPLTDISLGELYETWNEAFKDYVRSWTKEEFERMLFRRGYEPALSLGAFDNDELVSFTLNGIGEFNGRPSGYDTGTGTIEAYRGKGLAAAIFEHSLPLLREAGVARYVLEVLQDNTTAVSIYTKAGFQVTRSFNYFVRDMSMIQTADRRLSGRLQIQEIDLAYKEQMMDCWDFYPSWQNRMEAIERKPGDFKMLGVFDHHMSLLGYGMIEEQSGDIPQLAVAKNHRRKGFGSVLLRELLKYNKHTLVRIINTDVACEPMTAFLEYSGIPKAGMQYEMIREV
jgi:ribosomal protein S18 acetylase RimI-like enzyme